MCGVEAGVQRGAPHVINRYVILVLCVLRLLPSKAMMAAMFLCGKQSAKIL